MNSLRSNSISCRFACLADAIQESKKIPIIVHPLKTSSCGMFSNVVKKLPHRAVTSFARLARPRMFSKKTWRTKCGYDFVAWLVQALELCSLATEGTQECFRGAPRRQAVSVVGVKKIWRTLSVSEGQRLESHTKTLMERASSLNQLSPLPKIGEGFGEWSEALLRIKEGWVVVTMQGSALQNLSGARKKMNNKKIY